MNSTAAPLVSLSSLDTQRFGVRIARLPLVRAEHLPEVLQGCRRERIAMLVARTAAEDLRAAQAVERAGGLLCDTLVYFTRPLGRELPEEGAGVRLAAPADADAVSAIAAAAFSGYGGHYHADPRLDRDAADAAYADWARRSCTVPGVADRVWVVEDGGVVAGFLTLRVNDAAETEIVLNAVHPGHQRRGLYGRLVQSALRWSRERGAERCIISTQLSNVPVQKSWVRLGFEPSHAFHTFHLWLAP